LLFLQFQQGSAVFELFAHLLLWAAVLVALFQILPPV